MRGVNCYCRHSVIVVGGSLAVSVVFLRSRCSTNTVMAVGGWLVTLPALVLVWLFAGEVHRRFREACPIGRAVRGAAFDVAAFDYAQARQAREAPRLGGRAAASALALQEVDEVRGCRQEGGGEGGAPRHPAAEGVTMGLDPGFCRDDEGLGGS